MAIPISKLININEVIESRGFGDRPLSRESTDYVRRYGDEEEKNASSTIQSIKDLCWWRIAFTYFNLWKHVKYTPDGHLAVAKGLLYDLEIEPTDENLREFFREILKQEDNDPELKKISL